MLMYLVHHYLRAEGRGPADALHRAQLWMLDPNRGAPVGMPPELARHIGDGLARPVAWAGFTHLGQ
jgi:CHAT domain-containing protein